MTIPTSGIDVLYSNRNSNIMTVGTGASTLARDFKSDCSDSGLGQPLAGETKNILGCDVLHIAYGDNRMAKSGAREMDHFSHWVAPSLNCYPVEEEFIYYRDGKQYHQESRTLTKVILGEPPADAFKMPTGVETPPSVFWPPLGHQLPQQMAAKQDAFYYRRKAQRSAFRLP